LKRKVRNSQRSRDNNKPIKTNYPKLFKDFSNVNKSLAQADKITIKLNQKRQQILLKIFNELEKNPANYQHIMIKRGKKKAEPITPRIIKQFRAKLRQAANAEPNPHGGPGCRCCEDLDGCWCAFKLGPFCCYLCASPAVIQCYW
jgi:hypothetical protein